jgi:glycosyltransferase involved in cell wall biosynthesis
MNGFTMQQTEFPYVCCILDDCSTDGEQEVIKKYLQENFNLEDKLVVRKEETDDYVLCFAQHKVNENCFFLVLFLKYNHYSIKKAKLPYLAEWNHNAKYLAMCEGDDYWIDNYKLQHQVVFLDSHPEYMMFLHNALVRYQDSDKPDKILSNFKTGDIDTTKLFKYWQLPLASVVYRTCILNSGEYKELSKDFHGGFLFFMTSIKMGKIYGLAKCLSVYRKNLGGVSNAMTPSWCLRVECNYAKASKDKGAIGIMKKKAIRRMTSFIPRLFRQDSEAKEMAKVAWNYDHSIIFMAIIRFFLRVLPTKIIKKRKND